MNEMNLTSKRKYFAIGGTVLFLLLCDTLLVRGEAERIKSIPQYEQMCVANVMTNGMVERMLMRKFDADPNTQERSAIEVFYVKRGLAKAIGDC